MPSITLLIDTVDFKVLVGPLNSLLKDVEFKTSPCENLYPRQVFDCYMHISNLIFVLNTVLYPRFETVTKTITINT